MNRPARSSFSERDELTTVIKIKYRPLVAALCLFLCIAVLCSAATGRFSPKRAGTKSGQLPIILYHIISPNRTRYGITPGEFESDLSYLSKNGYTTITMTDLIEHVNFGKKLPEKPVILSFDDGYFNNYVYAFPLLKKYHAKMVFSIIGKSTDDFTAHPSNNLNYSHVTWTQLNEMIQCGLVEVQNHTYHLHEIRNGRIGCMQKKNESFQEYEKSLSDDLNRLQSEMAKKTGKIPNTFVYPYGKSSKNTDVILKKLGFQATLSCRYGINRIPETPDELFELCRMERSHGKSLKNMLKRTE